MTVFRRLWFFLTRWRRVTDLDDEMRLHVELRTASNRRRGLAPDEAVHEAKRRFGNPLKLREEGRDLWGFLGLERVGRDLRYALRQVIRRPASTLVIVPTLALGIGANTSVFTLVDAMLFRPAPWNHTDRLVWISSIRGRSSEIGYLSYADYLAYRESAKTLSGVLAFGGNGVSVGGPHHLIGPSAAWCRGQLLRRSRHPRGARADDHGRGRQRTRCASGRCAERHVLESALWRGSSCGEPGRRHPNGRPFNDRSASLRLDSPASLTPTTPRNSGCRWRCRARPCRRIPASWGRPMSAGCRSSGSAETTSRSPKWTQKMRRHRTALEPPAPRLTVRRALASR